MEIQERIHRGVGDKDESVFNSLRLADSDLLGQDESATSFGAEKKMMICLGLTQGTRKTPSCCHRASSKFGYSPNSHPPVLSQPFKKKKQNRKSLEGANYHRSLQKSESCFLNTKPSNGEQHPQQDLQTVPSQNAQFLSSRLSLRS